MRKHQSNIQNILKNFFSGGKLSLLPLEAINVSIAEMFWNSEGRGEAERA